MHFRKIAAIALLIGSTSLAFAHAPKVGANGGPQADAGSYHVEVVPKGTTLLVYLRDHSDKAVQSAGYKGTAIFVVEGKPQRIPLSPDGDNKLTGTSPVALPAAPKGAVQITTPTGSTVQAKF
ncbi:MAG TPA: hypothetical protein VM867_12480 [Xanthobacteraceae bacterium]|jgi:hypothetical protein|nr:hypothetical protein [Xanthobacteraceae bacterium]